MNSGKEVRPRKRLGRHLLTGLAYIPGAIILCGLMALFSWWHYQFTYSPGAVLATGTALGLLAMVLSPALRSTRWGITLVVALAALLLLGNPVKISMLRMPISVADAQSLPVLFSTMGGLRLFLGLSAAVGAIALLLRMFRYRWSTLFWLLVASGLLAVIPIIAAMPVWGRLLPLSVTEREMYDGSKVVVDHIDDPVAFLRARGPVLYLATDWNYLYRDGDGPSESEIKALPLRKWVQLPSAPTRNIHVVLLESLWDVSVLARHRTSVDPLDPRFRAMWAAAGYSHALSPVFGGVTANAEFEVLCGFPAPRNSVAFVSNLRRSSPCLPAAFAAAGYDTMASHAHQATNWNRQRAYQTVGFDLYRPISAFDLDDMDGSYLSDGSFFRQNIEFLRQRNSSRPVFNYQVTLSSHWAYTRDRNARPDLVKVSPANAQLLNDYVNAIAYTSRAFMDWTEQILANDPDALIIGFGDHAPVLARNGVDEDIYADVNKNSPSQHFDNARTRSLLGLSRTPLLVIDGDRGPVQLGRDTPLYEIPNVISHLLGDGELLPQSAQRGQITVRPFIGHLLAGVQGAWQDCAPPSAADSPVCMEARRQFELDRTLRRDAIRGDGHFLRATGAEALSRRRTTGMQLEHGTCTAEVDQWGPQEGITGIGFNVQDDGSSGIWISTKAMHGQPVVRVGDTIGKSMYSGNVITSEFNASDIRHAAGPLPVTLQCGQEPPVLLGKLVMKRRNAETASSVATASIDALRGLTITQFGPNRTKAGQGFNTQIDGSSAIWATADRDLTGFDASLWLNGQKLGQCVVSGATISGTAPVELLSKPATLSLEIRIGEDGSTLRSGKVEFIVE